MLLVCLHASCFLAGKACENKNNDTCLNCVQVPNIKGVENRSIVSIAEEGLAQAGRLGQEDLSGGTLTVSNIGAIGGTYATPLVNVPEVAIVALGK